MSLQPDFIFQTLLVRGFQTLKNNPKLIDQLFRNIPQKTLAQIKELFYKHPLPVFLNYPRQTITVPSVIILLKNESESQAWLGDSMGMDYAPHEVFGYNGDSPADGLVAGIAGAGGVYGDPVTVFGPYVLTSSSPLAITINSTDSPIYPDQFSGQNLKLRILDGDGAGQVRKVVSNTKNTFTLDASLSVLPTNGDIFEITRDASEVVGGEPSKLYDNLDRRSFVERKGGLYSSSYQFIILGQNQEQAIYLFTIIKSLMYINRNKLEENGIISFRLSASDLVQRSEAYPDNVYQRVMNVEFTNPFDIFIESNYPSQLHLLVDEAYSGETIIDQTFDIGNDTPIVGGE